MHTRETHSWLRCAPLATALLLSACSGTTPIDGKSAVSVERAAQELGDAAEIFVPEGEGPFPVVVAFHGCGGNGPVQEAYAEVARNMGIMAVVVDSYEPRGIGGKKAMRMVCSGMRLQGKERAGDVIAALAFVRGLPGADKERVALVGWSHGAWSIMDALAMRLDYERPPGLASMPDRPFAGVQGAVLLYPYCGSLALTGKDGWETPMPVQFILAGDDTVVGTKPCILAAEALFQQGVDVALEIIPGQAHAFDEPERTPKGGLRYNPRAAARSQAVFAEFLRQRLQATEPKGSSATAMINPNREVEEP